MNDLGGVLYGGAWFRCFVRRVGFADTALRHHLRGQRRLIAFLRVQADLLNAAVQALYGVLYGRDSCFCACAELKDA